MYVRGNHLRQTSSASAFATGQCPTDMHPSALGSHNWFGYLDVDDVGSLHAEFVARGAVCSAPKDTYYGMREIVVTTIDGHRLVCGQPLKRA